VKLFRTGLVGLLVAASVIFVPIASADPDAVAAAKEKLDRIHEESANLDAQLIETITRAEESESKLETLKQDLSAQESKVSQLGTNLGDLAMMQLNGGGMDITGQLLGSSDDTTFLSGLTTIQNETDRSMADLQTLQVEQARLDTLRGQQETITESLKADRAAKEKLAKEYEAKEAEAQQVYDRLSAEEQERLRKLEEQRQQEEAAREQATRESASPTPSPSTGAGDKSDPPPSSSGGGSGRAQQAVSYALAQVGKGYVMGTTGPSTFDCSGLMYAAYKQVGISLPRTSQAQFSAGTSVSKGDLQPGDLVFYYGGITHVGMYIGNGQIVHAANPRSGVVTAGVNSMPYQGARRVA
jgi:putative NPL/P60 family secreted protein